jgi:hypothetical protein
MPVKLDEGGTPPEKKRMRREDTGPCFADRPCHLCLSLHRGGSLQGPAEFVWVALFLTFTKVAKGTGRIPQPFAGRIVESIEAFDNRYRTGEAHGAGSSRLWSYLYLQGEESSPQEEMFWAWNSLN